MTNPQPACDPLAESRVPLYGPQFQRKSADLYAEMWHANGPVAPVLLDGDVPAWLVLGYREVQYVVSDPEVFGRDSRRWNAWDRVPSDWPLLPLIGYQPTMMFAEGAEHQRRAEALGDALADVDQFALRAQAQQVADRLIDTFAGAGEADLIAQYADRVPLPVVARMIGVPDAETADLVREVNKTHAAGEGAHDAYTRVREKVRRLVESKRQAPASDVTSRLMAHDAALADEEITEDLLHLMNAGQLPTAYWIGNALRLMLTDDRFAMTPVRRTPERRPGAQRGALGGHSHSELPGPVRHLRLAAGRSADPQGRLAHPRSCRGQPRPTRTTGPSDVGRQPGVHVCQQWRTPVPTRGPGDRESHRRGRDRGPARPPPGRGSGGTRRCADMAAVATVSRLVGTAGEVHSGLVIFPRRDSGFGRSPAQFSLDEVNRPGFDGVWFVSGHVL
jgi:hypothetical protein